MPEETSAPQKKEGKPQQLQVKKQLGAGFIVFRRTPEGTKFLFLYRRGNYWNFPKGKFEEGENALKAALRETAEETGIKEAELRILPNWRAHLKYNFRIGNERIYDTVILFMAETKKAEVAIVPREHSGYAWFLYSDAVKMLGGKYVGTKRILKQANDFLRRGRTGPGPDGPIANGNENSTGTGSSSASPERQNGRRRRRGRGTHRPVRIS